MKAKVIVSVRSGVAEATYDPDLVEVVIIDFDHMEWVSHPDEAKEHLIEQFNARLGEFLKIQANIDRDTRISDTVLENIKDWLLGYLTPQQIDGLEQSAIEDFLQSQKTITV